MATRSMRVKVKTAELLAAVEAKLPEAEKALAEVQADNDAMMAAHAAAVAKLASEMKAWRKQLMKLIGAALSSMSDDDDRLNIYRASSYRSDPYTQVTIELGHEAPVQPTLQYDARPFAGVNEKLRQANYSLDRIKRTIATLKIAADEAISISADDYAEYLGG